MTEAARREAGGPPGPALSPPLTIAVVDSGINPTHPQVGPVAGGVRIALVEGEVRYADDWRDGLGHGTAVAAAISEDLPEEGWRLLSVRVFGRRLEAPSECLAAGIRWAAKHRARLVNLSAGIPLGSDPAGEALLAEACVEAARAGLAILAPRRSGETPLAPGALTEIPGVIAVEADPAIPRREVVRRGPALAASPWARPLPPLPKENNFSGVSLAVAAVTNHAARLALAEGTSHPGSLDLLPETPAFLRKP